MKGGRYIGRYIGRGEERKGGKEGQGEIIKLAYVNVVPLKAGTWGTNFGEQWI